jgi:hypothetical protein
MLARDIIPLTFNAEYDHTYAHSTNDINKVEAAELTAGHFTLMAVNNNDNSIILAITHTSIRR